MTTASDDGERFCPLCLEEMDLTDQQLKACKCGYDICLLCWHHLIEVSEKDGAEGRCPNCRTPYDKPKILGMGAKCERVIAEMNAKKRQKSQKTKTKASADAKKHLTTVRVIQRNLVYIIGLPSNLCDENILERKEYFGQYGKVLKVSISRPSATTSQQSSNNNTFSVYITYSKEEEAIRCIQAVHNYVLDGKSLRACFGTTKYCHAWLRNMPCSNPDCLYLHDIGNQEDSFTKDEIISAYTRIRVPQIASNSSQRRAGNVLPPPADELNTGSKNQVKGTLSTNGSMVKIPPSTSQSAMLPAGASWGLKASNSRPSTAGVACSPISSINHKLDRNSHSSLSSRLDESIKQSSAWHDEVCTKSKVPETSSSMISASEECSEQPSAWHDEEDMALKLPESKNRLHISGRSQPNEPLGVVYWKDMRLNGSLQGSLDADFDSRLSAWNDDSVGDDRSTPYLDGGHRPIDSVRPVSEETQISIYDRSLDVSDVPCTSLTSSSCLSSLMSSPKDGERGISIESNNKIQIDGPIPRVPKVHSGTSGPEQVYQAFATSEGLKKGLCSAMSSVRIESEDRANQLNMSNNLALNSEICRSHFSNPSLVSLVKDSILFDQVGKPEITDSCSKSINQGLVSECNGIGESRICYNNGIRPSDATHVLSSSPSLNHLQTDANYSSTTSNDDGGYNQTSYIVQDLDMKAALSPFRERVPVMSNGYKEDGLNGAFLASKDSGLPELRCGNEQVKPLGTFGDISNHNNSATTSIDAAGERSIISDILSLEVDPWDDSLFSADNFAKLLGETDKQESAFSLSGSQSTNQSRFSFARQETEANNQDLPVKENGHAQTYYSLQNELQDSFQNSFQTGALFNSFDGRSTTVNDNNVISSDRLSGISKAKVSVPPGFSAPSRAIPTVVSSQDRFDQAYETSYSEYCPHGNSSAGNNYQTHSVRNPGDVEFIDPAILAVGKGRIPLGVASSLESVFPSQLSTSDGDPRLHLLMQQSLVSHQNLRVADHLGDRFLPINDAYITSRLLAQNHGNISFAQMPLQQQRNSHFTNNRWDGWNDLRAANNMGISEILINERLGINNYYSGNEEHKFHISNGDIYSRAFGM